MRRISLLIILGIGVGLAVGLFIGWVVAPVQYVHGPMSSLKGDYKDEYTVMVAEAFQVDGDTNEALERLRPLDVPNGNIPVYVQDVTERFISEKGTGRESDIRSLVALASALGRYTPIMQPFAAPGNAPTPQTGS